MAGRGAIGAGGVGGVAPFTPKPSSGTALSMSPETGAASGASEGPGLRCGLERRQANEDEDTGNPSPAGETALFFSGDPAESSTVSLRLVLPYSHW